MSDYARRKNTEVMRSHVALAGKAVADVGCGDGALVRFMTREGAKVIGIECGELQLARARAAVPVGDEQYLFGRGEALPLPDATLDLVVFFNSLHHVPVAQQGMALTEAARVLKPGGLLYVMEPLAEGTYFTLMLPLDDETEVRAKAYDAIGAAVAAGSFEQILEERYTASFSHDSFAACKANSIAVDPARETVFAAIEEDLARAFEAAAEKRDDAYWFDQPSRLNLLRRI